MAKAPEPVAPFAGWPVQYVEPSVGYYWYLEPATLICQSYAPHGSFEVIERHNDLVDRVLARHRKSIEAAGGLFMLFDWRSVRGYDTLTRARVSVSGCRRVARRTRGALWSSSIRRTGC
jgi:hypothetical protein